MKRFPLSPTAIGTLACALAVLLLPVCLKNNYALTVLTFVALNTILAVGLNLLMGYAGQVSLGHAAFFGVGAYTSAILTTTLHWNPWLAILASLALTALVALLVGIPCLRLRGHYLAVATLGFGWIVYIVMVQWDVVTQGTSGITSIPKLALGSLVFDSDLKRYYLSWGAAILALLLTANIVNSRVGRALRALHGSETAAATLGVNVAAYKIQVFVISAVMAAFAGSLYAHIVNFISPNVFGFIASVSLVVMCVIGGMASVWGAPLGAATITLLVEWLRWLGDKQPRFQEFDVIAHGLILVLVLIFMPAGLTAGVRDLCLRAWRRRQQPAAPAKTETGVTP
jgi:branched-chain amino acid transport system permease protein